MTDDYPWIVFEICVAPDETIAAIAVGYKDWRHFDVTNREQVALLRAAVDLLES